jgi:hypothetical protein
VRFLFVGLFGALVCFGQMVVEPDKVPAVQKEFEHRPGEVSLACTVTPVKPAIDFSFRFHSGYTANIPLKQYSGSGHGFVVLVKVTPDDNAHQPVYLSSAAKLPDVPKSNDEIEAGGSYLLGEGSYTVDLLLFDDAHRTCRSHWVTEVKLAHTERNIRLRIPPSSVWAVSSTNIPEPVKNAATGSRSLRLTVLLNAAPVHARGTVISPDDRELLLGSLASLIEQLPSASIHLVVFNLDQQKKIFSDERFTTANLEKIGEAMDQLELASVKYDVLQNTTGHFSLLAGLVKDELKDQERSDAIIFFGPASHYVDAIPKSLLEEPPGPIPEFFYLQLRPVVHLSRLTQPMRPPMQRRGLPPQGFPRGGGELPDVIESVMKRLHGKTFKVRTPGEFATAISELDTKTAH